MTFALGVPIGAVIALVAMHALCVWMASRDDDRI